MCGGIYILSNTIKIKQSFYLRDRVIGDRERFFSYIKENGLCGIALAALKSEKNAVIFAASLKRSEKLDLDSLALAGNDVPG